MRALALCLLLLPGCQCLVPVDEDGGELPDAGVTPMDASAPECTTARDCPAAPPQRCAFSGDDAGRSCLDQRCVYDCDVPRTCRSTLGSCLSCDGGVPSCSGGACNSVQANDTGRFYSRCTPNPQERAFFTLRYQQGATCHFDIFDADGGGRLGTLAMLGDDSQISGTVTAEPGVTCTVRPLATALNRLELGCHDCMYLLEWP